MFEVKEVDGIRRIVNGDNFRLTVSPEYHADGLEILAEILNDGLTKRTADLCQVCGTMVSLSATKCLVCGTSR